MTKEESDKLTQARNLIFEVEQSWRKDGRKYGADTLFATRRELNNAMSRG